MGYRYYLHSYMYTYSQDSDWERLSGVQEDSNCLGAPLGVAWLQACGAERQQLGLGSQLLPVNRCAKFLLQASTNQRGKVAVEAAIIDFERRVIKRLSSRRSMPLVRGQSL